MAKSKETGKGTEPSIPQEEKLIIVVCNGNMFRSPIVGDYLSSKLSGKNMRVIARGVSEHTLLKGPSRREVLGGYYYIYRRIQLALSSLESSFAQYYNARLQGPDGVEFDNYPQTLTAEEVKRASAIFVVTASVLVSLKKTYPKQAKKFRLITAYPFLPKIHPYQDKNIPDLERIDSLAGVDRGIVHPKDKAGVALVLDLCSTFSCDAILAYVENRRRNNLLKVIRNILRSSRNTGDENKDSPARDGVSKRLTGDKDALRCTWSIFGLEGLAILALVPFVGMTGDEQWPFMGSNKKLIDFTLGKRPDHEGRFISDIWGFTHGQLEDEHNYIQLLFPTKKLGFFIYEIIGRRDLGVDRIVPAVFTDKSIVVFRASTKVGRKLRAAMAKSLAVMLDFYGFKYEVEGDEVSVQLSEKFEQRRQNWLSRPNDNFLRITRILESLHLVGLDNYAIVLFRALSELNEIHGSVIGDSFDYWRRAVENISPDSKLTVEEFNSYSEDLSVFILPLVCLPVAEMAKEDERSSVPESEHKEVVSSYGTGIITNIDAIFMNKTYSIGSFSVSSGKLYTEHEEILKSVLNNLMGFYRRAPPHIREQIQGGFPLHIIKFVITADSSILCINPKTNQPYTVSSNIESYTVFVHPHFFKLPELKQLEIFIQELIARISKRISDYCESTKLAKSWISEIGLSAGNKKGQQHPGHKGCERGEDDELGCLLWPLIFLPAAGMAGDEKVKKGDVSFARNMDKKAISHRLPKILSILFIMSGFGVLSILFAPYYAHKTGVELFVVNCLIYGVTSVLGAYVAQVLEQLKGKREILDIRQMIRWGLAGLLILGPVIYGTFYPLLEHSQLGTLTKIAIDLLVFGPLVVFPLIFYTGEYYVHPGIKGLKGTGKASYIQQFKDIGLKRYLFMYTIFMAYAGTALWIGWDFCESSFIVFIANARVPWIIVYTLFVSRYVESKDKKIRAGTKEAEPSKSDEEVGCFAFLMPLTNILVINPAFQALFFDEVPRRIRAFNAGSETLNEALEYFKGVIERDEGHLNYISGCFLREFGYEDTVNNPLFVETIRFCVARIVRLILCYKDESEITDIADEIMNDIKFKEKGERPGQLVVSKPCIAMARVKVVHMEIVPYHTHYWIFTHEVAHWLRFKKYTKGKDYASSFDQLVEPVLTRGEHFCRGVNLFYNTYDLDKAFKRIRINTAWYASRTTIRILAQHVVLYFLLRCLAVLIIVVYLLISKASNMPSSVVMSIINWIVFSFTVLNTINNLAQEFFIESCWSYSTFRQRAGIVYTWVMKLDKKYLTGLSSRKMRELAFHFFAMIARGRSWKEAQDAIEKMILMSENCFVKAWGKALGKEGKEIANQIPAIWFEQDKIRIKDGKAFAHLPSVLTLMAERLKDLRAACCAHKTPFRFPDSSVIVLGDGGCIVLRRIKRNSHWHAEYYPTKEEVPSKCCYIDWSKDCLQELIWHLSTDAYQDAYIGAQEREGECENEPVREQVRQKIREFAARPGCFEEVLAYFRGLIEENEGYLDLICKGFISELGHDATARSELFRGIARFCVCRIVKRILYDKSEAEVLDITKQITKQLYFVLRLEGDAHGAMDVFTKNVSVVLEKPNRFATLAHEVSHWLKAKEYIVKDYSSSFDHLVDLLDGFTPKFKSGIKIYNKAGNLVRAGRKIKWIAAWYAIRFCVTIIFASLIISLGVFLTIKFFWLMDYLLSLVPRPENAYSTSSSNFIQEHSVPISLISGAVIYLAWIFKQKKFESEWSYSTYALRAGAVYAWIEEMNASYNAGLNEKETRRLAFHFFAMLAHGHSWQEAQQVIEKKILMTQNCFIKTFAQVLNKESKQIAGMLPAAWFEDDTVIIDTQRFDRGRGKALVRLRAMLSFMKDVLDDMGISWAVRRNVCSFTFPSRSAIDFGSRGLIVIEEGSDGIEGVWHAYYYKDHHLLSPGSGHQVDEKSDCFDELMEALPKEDDLNQVYIGAQEQNKIWVTTDPLTEHDIFKFAYCIKAAGIERLFVLNQSVYAYSFSGINQDRVVTFAGDLFRLVVLVDFPDLYVEFVLKHLTPVIIFDKTRDTLREYIQRISIARPDLVLPVACGFDDLIKAGRRWPDKFNEIILRNGPKLIIRGFGLIVGDGENARDSLNGSIGQFAHEYKVIAMQRGLPVVLIPQSAKAARSPAIVAARELFLKQCPEFHEGQRPYTFLAAPPAEPKNKPGFGCLGPTAVELGYGVIIVLVLSGLTMLFASVAEGIVITISQFFTSGVGGDICSALVSISLGQFLIGWFVLAVLVLFLVLPLVIVGGVRDTRSRQKENREFDYSGRKDITKSTQADRRYPSSPADPESPGGLRCAVPFFGLFFLPLAGMVKAKSGSTVRKVLSKRVVVSGVAALALLAAVWAGVVAGVFDWADVGRFLEYCWHHEYPRDVTHLGLIIVAGVLYAIGRYLVSPLFRRFDRYLKEGMGPSGNPFIKDSGDSQAKKDQTGKDAAGIVRQDDELRRGREEKENASPDDEIGCFALAPLVVVPLAELAGCISILFFICEIEGDSAGIWQPGERSKQHPELGEDEDLEVLLLLVFGLLTVGLLVVLIRAGANAFEDWDKEIRKFREENDRFWDRVDRRHEESMQELQESTRILRSYERELWQIHRGQKEEFRSRMYKIWRFEFLKDFARQIVRLHSYKAEIPGFDVYRFFDLKSEEDIYAYFKLNPYIKVLELLDLLDALGATYKRTGKEFCEMLVEDGVVASEFEEAYRNSQGKDIDARIEAVVRYASQRPEFINEGRRMLSITVTTTIKELWRLLHSEDILREFSHDTFPQSVFNEWRRLSLFYVSDETNGSTEDPEDLGCFLFPIPLMFLPITGIIYGFTGKRDESVPVVIVSRGLFKEFVFSDEVE